MEILDHPQFMQELIGYDPWSNPVQAYVDAYRALDTDWVVDLPRQSVRLAVGELSRKECSGKIYTEWGLSGSSWREEYLFHDIEGVLRYDPVTNEQGEELVTPEYNQQKIEERRAAQELLDDSAIVTGVYYTTLFQFPIMVFGWELFLTAAASEPKVFQSVLEGFADVSRRNLKAWAAEDMDLILVHDDIAMESGLVFQPEWYRKYLFPLYESLMEPLRTKLSLKIAFVSDGDYTPVLPDLVALGFDGLMINPCMNLGDIARRFGGRVFLMGNVNTSILTFGRQEDVVREVRRCLDEARPAAGHFIRAGGDLPHNIPLENIRTYFDIADKLSRQT